MSKRWETEIQKWYDQSRISDLQYLDLAESEKVTLKHINHNLTVVYDRSQLFSRVSIKNFKSLQESVLSLENRVTALEQSHKNLIKLFTENRPLTRSEVHTLVSEISKQPKAIEAQALQVSEELNRKIDRVEKLLHKVEKWVSS